MTPQDDADYFHMARALYWATKSNDPSTQNGAVISSNKTAAIVYGYNDWPEGVKGTWERPDKYDYCEHAERAAIYCAALNGIATYDTTMYCPWAACADCARGIVVSGIRELVRLPFNNDTLVMGGKWGPSCIRGDQIMREGGVIIREIELSRPVGITLRRDGKDLEF